MSIRIDDVNKELYTEFKQLVKQKTNEFIMGYTTDLFEKAIQKEIEILKKLPDKNNRRK